MLVSVPICSETNWKNSRLPHMLRVSYRNSVRPGGEVGCQYPEKPMPDDSDSASQPMTGLNWKRQCQGQEYGHEGLGSSRHGTHIDRPRCSSDS